jgi:hypothetical protein
MNVAKRAGITAHVHPHLMRHAFGDHVARYAGIKNAQALLGHATVGTTETYVGKPTLDELAAAVSARSLPRTTPRGVCCESLSENIGITDTYLQGLGADDSWRRCSWMARSGMPSS